MISQVCQSSSQALKSLHHRKDIVGRVSTVFGCTCGHVRLTDGLRQCCKAFVVEHSLPRRLLCFDGGAEMTMNLLCRVDHTPERRVPDHFQLLVHVGDCRSQELHRLLQFHGQRSRLPLAGVRTAQQMLHLLLAATEVGIDSISSALGYDLLQTLFNASQQQALLVHQGLPHVLLRLQHLLRFTPPLLQLVKVSNGLCEVPVTDCSDHHSWDCSNETSHWSLFQLLHRKRSQLL
mmetsp:Transcript_12228/g.21722  ORF Transcript_12228/g.21722 Transcript_12228/m.21722 type:complete len:234 (+) Transcript_12228:884-1585(+)